MILIFDKLAFLHTIIDVVRDMERGGYHMVCPVLMLMLVPNYTAWRQRKMPYSTAHPKPETKIKEIN